MMHVLISVTAALLMQTPGVHISGLRAATAVEMAAAPEGHGFAVAYAPHGRACLCPVHRRVS
jgi:hypothetical protein